MMEVILYLVVGVICLFFGAWDIRDAIICFIKGEYFRCGVNVMLAAWMIIILAEAVFAS